MTTHKIARWLVLGLLASASLANAQSFVRASDNLLDLYNGAIEWADLDNDGDLDIIHQGFADGANEFFTNVYENINGSLVAKTTALPHLRNAGLALGDYDKDGDLDVLLSGLDGSGNVSVLYRNDGAFSFALKESFPGVLNSTPSWFDIDNDEDLDFLITGVDDTSPTDPFINKIFVYENTGSSFVPLTDTGLPGCSQCSIDWADSNGDGKIDVVMMGFVEDFRPMTHVYLNTGNKTFIEDTQSVLKQGFNGDVKWGDFDNDSDMDVLFAGVLADGNIVTQVYENINGVLKVREDIALHSTGETWFGGNKWVDYNNDGLLDILISGRGTSIIVVERIMELYKNNGDGTFHKVQEENFTGLAASSVDFGDYDNDGDLDICYTGLNSIGAESGIFENKLFDEASTNSRPLGNNFATETLEDEVFAFTAQPFEDAFSDPDVNDVLVSIVVKTLPQKGSLKLDNNAVMLDQIIPVSELNKLIFIPETNISGVTEFTFLVNDGTDTSYKVTINILPVNDAPVLSAISDQETESKTALSAIVFSVADVDSPIESIQLSAISDNQELIKNTGIIIQGTGNERSITISHEANLVGDALITLSASDGSTTSSTEFNVNVFSITAIEKSVNHVVHVFPNPFTSSLNVNLTEGYHALDRGQTKLILHDALGREVIKTSVTQHKSKVDLDQLHDGIYMISIVDNNGFILFHERVVKK